MLELKIPPPAQTLVCAAVMWLLGWAVPDAAFALPVARWLAMFLALVGVCFAAIGIVQFRRVGTTVYPMKPHKASQLVTGGVYRLSRNPMYVGMLLLLAGWGFYVANFLAFLCLPLFVLSITKLQIVPEERALREKFGEEFSTYQREVRRWL